MCRLFHGNRQMYLPYSRHKCHELSGPDYTDPAGYVEVMTSDTSIGTKYSRPYLAEGLQDENGNSIYEPMVNAARAETKDINRRYVS